jgi:hypothetical protein
VNRNGLLTESSSSSRAILRLSDGGDDDDDVSGGGRVESVSEIASGGGNRHTEGSAEIVGEVFAPCEDTLNAGVAFRGQLEARGNVIGRGGSIWVLWWEI